MRQNRVLLVCLIEVWFCCEVKVCMGGFKGRDGMKQCSDCFDMSGIDLWFLVICWGELYYDLFIVVDYWFFIDVDIQVGSLLIVISFDMFLNLYLVNMW